MTQEHLAALLGAVEATKDADGWLALPEGRSLTLYISSGNATLSVGHVRALKQDHGLIHARTNKNELFIVALEDAYAGSLDAPTGAAKPAGFR